MKLVSDARNWWKWHSTYVFAALAVLPTVWLLPPKWAASIAPPLAVLGFFLRIHKQAQNLPPPVDPKP